MHAQDGRRLAAIAAGTLVALGVMSQPAPAQIVPESDADIVAQAIAADPLQLDLAQTDWEERATALTGSDPFPAAVTPLAIGGFPTTGTTAAILSSGDVTIFDQPNDDDGSGAALAEEVDDGDASDRTDNGPLHGNTDNDVTVLRVGVNVPAGANCITLDYRFLTEEYPEYVDDIYNDAFIAEIDTLAWTTTDDVIGHAGDFATTPAGEPVSVDGVGGVAMNVDEAFGTTYDGATGRVTTKSPITPGPHRIYLSIFDQGDQILDSAVMLDRLSFITEPPATCKPPEVPAVPPPPPAPPGPPPPPPPPPNDISVPGGSVTFRNGAATITVQVPGPGTLTAGQAPAAGASRRAVASAKRKLIKPAKAIAKQAGAVTLKLRPTKAGKKQLRKRGRIKVSLAVTFTPTGGTPNTEISKLTIKAKKKKKHR